MLLRKTALTPAHLHVGEQTNNYTERYEHRQCAMHPLD